VSIFEADIHCPSLALLSILWHYLSKWSQKCFNLQQGLGVDGHISKLDALWPFYHGRSILATKCFNTPLMEMSTKLKQACCPLVPQFCVTANVFHSSQGKRELFVRFDKPPDFAIIELFQHPLLPLLFPWLSFRVRITLGSTAAIRRSASLSLFLW